MEGPAILRGWGARWGLDGQSVMAPFFSEKGNFVVGGLEGCLGQAEVAAQFGSNGVCGLEYVDNLAAVSYLGRCGSWESGELARPGI